MLNTGELRRFLANLAVGVVQGDTTVDKATASIKACKEINTSLYSEIKAALMQRQLGQPSGELGELPLMSRNAPKPK